MSSGRPANVDDADQRWFAFHVSSDDVLVRLGGQSHRQTAHRIERPVRDGIVAGLEPFIDTVVVAGLHPNYVGVTLAAWLFAFSTMISWSYYGEQSVVFPTGGRAVLAHKLLFCMLIIVATLGDIDTDADLDNLTGFGTGVMLFANVPIMLIFGYQAMRAYRSYIQRLKDGRLGPGHPPPSLEDLVSGKDVR